MRPLHSVLVLSVFVAFHSGCIEGPQGPAGPPGSGGGLETLTDPTVMPKVIFTDPPMNSVGPYPSSPAVGRIVIRFNKIMVLASLKKALHVSSSHESVYIDTASLTTTGGDMIVVSLRDANKPSSPILYRIGQIYTLQIDSNAVDVNGNRLQPTFSMWIQPEPYFRVKGSEPQNGARDQSTYGRSLLLYFNNRVTSSIFQYIHISPSIEGEWSLYSYDSMAVYFSRSSYVPRLKHDTTYSMSVKASARDIDGNSLSFPYTTSFRTIGFKLSNTEPRDGSYLYNLNQSISFGFTGNIDTLSVRNIVNIIPSMEGDYQCFTPPTSHFRWIPQGNFAPATSYSISLKAGILHADGQLEAGASSLTVYTDSFRVKYTYPENFEVNVGRWRIIEVGLNAILDTNSVPGSFLITPSVQGTFLKREYYYGPTIAFSPTGSLASRTTYHVTITSNLRMLEGYPLQRPYTFSFTTGDK